MFPQLFSFAPDFDKGAPSLLPFPLLSILSEKAGIGSLNPSQQTLVANYLGQLGAVNTTNTRTNSALIGADLQNQLAFGFLSKNYIPSVGLPSTGEFGLSYLPPSTCVLNSPLASFAPNNPGNPFSARLDTSGLISCFLPFAAVTEPTKTKNVSGFMVDKNVTNADSHTIIRAPVLYNTSQQSEVGELDSNKKSLSPTKSVVGNSPDRIVASCAVAARAAVIACKRPLSDAAEMLLLNPSENVGASSSTCRIRRSRVPGMNKSQFNPPTSITTLASLPPQSDELQHNSRSKVQVSKWISSWTRIVDQRTNAVAYISPAGIQFNSLDAIKSHLSERNASSCETISDACINSNFCFDPSRDSCVIPAPADDIFTKMFGIFTTTSGSIESRSVCSIDIPTQRSSSTSDLKDSILIDEYAKRQRLHLSEDSLHATASSPKEIGFEVNPSHSNSRFFESLKNGSNVSALISELPTSASSQKINSDSTDFLFQDKKLSDCLSLSDESYSPTVASREISGNACHNPTSFSNPCVRQSTGDFLPHQHEYILNCTSENSTTHTFVSRSPSSDPGPSIVSSIISPSASSIMINQLLPLTAPARSNVTDIAPYFSRDLLFSAPGNISQYQQLVAASNLNELLRLNNLQQRSAIGGVQLVSAPWSLNSTNQLHASSATQVAIMQQQLSAVAEQYQRQQQHQAAALLMQHQQRQNIQLQTLQAYVAAFQSTQQCSLAHLSTFNNIPR